MQASLHVRYFSLAEYGGSHDIPFSKTGIRCRKSKSVQLTVPGSYGLEFQDWVAWNWMDLHVRVRRGRPANTEPA